MTMRAAPAAAPGPMPHPAPARATILGTGIMAHAFGERLGTCGIAATIRDPGAFVAARTEPQIVFSLLRTAPSALTPTGTLGLAPESILIDLCTQSTDAARRAAHFEAARGVAYCAGGVLGGGHEVAKGAAHFLIGPPPPEAAQAILRQAGRVHVFKDPAAACAAKLLHNFVLLQSNHAIAAALTIAPDFGISRLEDLLDLGTAGRKPSQSSAARDFIRGPTSTYTSALVRKDIAAILDSFPALAAQGGLGLAALAPAHGAEDPTPFTRAALALLEGAP